MTNSSKKPETSIVRSIVEDVSRKAQAVFNFTDFSEDEVLHKELDYRNHPPTFKPAKEEEKRFQESGEYKAMMLRIQTLEEKMKFIAEYADSQNLAKGKQIEYLIRISAKHQSSLTKTTAILICLILAQVINMAADIYFLKG